jgi:hypothetical protein
VTVKLEYKDLGLASFLKRVAEADVKAARVGVVGPKAQESSPRGTPYGVVALINEFGSVDGHVPERSFIRAAARDRNLVAAAAVAASVAYFRLNTSLTDALARGAEPIVREMRRLVATGVPPANAPETIRQKGFDHPLFETGGLEAAISHQVVRSGGDIVESGASVEEFQAFEVTGGGE